MIITILISIISVVLFLFSFWSRLREDYTQNQIFTTGFYTLLGIACGSILADNFAPPWWFWASFTGSILGLLLGLIRFRLRIFETLEAAVLAELLLFLVVFLTHLIENFSLITLWGTFGVIVFLGFYLFLDAHYKKFSWYKSGRVGFTGLTILGLFFLTRTVVAMFAIDMLSFVGDQEVIVSGILSFLSFMAVYNLSRQT